MHVFRLRKSNFIIAALNECLECLGVCVCVCAGECIYESVWMRECKCVCACVPIISDKSCICSCCCCILYLLTAISFASAQQLKNIEKTWEVSLKHTDTHASALPVYVSAYLQSLHDGRSSSITTAATTQATTATTRTTRINQLIN